MSEWWRRPQRIVQTNLRLADAGLDPRHLARQAKDFGATAILFNVGGIYATTFQTALPLQEANPFLENDLLGLMIDACRAENLHFMGRYDLSKGTEAAFAAHPDWFCRDGEGRPFEYNGSHHACINGGWYREQGPRVVEETLTRYDIDALFFNMFGYRRADYSHKSVGFCRCDNCAAGFAAFSGGKALPAGTDIVDPVYREYLRFQDKTAGELGQMFYDLVKRLRPGAGVANLGGYRDFIRMEANRSVVRPQPEWAYQAGEHARFARSVGRGVPASVAVTHFFDFPWRFTAETAAFQTLRLAQSLANGCEPHYYVMGTFEQDDEKPLAAVRDLFHFHARHQALYDGLESVARIGLYHSAKSERFASRSESRDVHDQTNAAFRGAYRSLLESGLAFDTVSDRRLRDADAAAMLDRYDVLLLPDVVCLGDGEAAALDAYVERGGALIATGRTGSAGESGDARAVNALDCLPIAALRRELPDIRGAYFQVEPGELALPGTRLIMADGYYIDVEPRAGSETCLDMLPPQRFGPPELCYAEAPPSGLPGVILGSHGRGKAVLVPWQPDRLFYRHGLVEHRTLLAQLVQRFTVAEAKLATASRLEMTVRRHRDSGETVVHLVNYAGQANNTFEEPVVQHGLRLGIRDVGGNNGRALIAEQDVALSPSDADGYRWLAVPPVRCLEVLVFPPGSGGLAPARGQG